LIPADQADKLRSFSADAESSGSLHPGQLAIIDEQRWFNLYVPRSHGGLELSLPEGLRMEEALAWTDGSLGWTVTLCSGANWFIGFLQPEIAKDLFSDRRSCFAGSGRASGIARITATGYEVTGRWKYASGAPHATAFTANCLLEKDGALLQNEDGSPMMRAFLFLKDEVIVHKDWNAMGMIATASHSFEVRQQQVGRDRCFTIDSHHSFLPQPIYRYPFLQLAETTLAVNSAGMAAHFIDLCEGIFARRSDHAGNKPRMGAATARLAEAKIVLQYLRQSFYRAVRSSWEECEKGNSLQEPLLQAVSRSSRALALEARRLVDELYPWCGLTAADRNTEINRVWRDLHTASQHSLL